MAEYIDKKEAKDELLAWAVCIQRPQYLRSADAMCVLDGIPAADVEQVTRCKDCYQSVVIGEVLHCTYWSKDTDENGYCHEGG